MIGIKRIAATVIILFICCVPLSSLATADPTPIPELVFREVKITGDEFVVLQNTGTADIAHLSDYWLGYSSSDTATAPPLQQLPDKPLAVGKVLLLSGGGTVDVCDASLITDLSPSLSDTKGSLALWQQSSGSFTQLLDPAQQAHWSKSTTTTSLPAGEIDLKKETTQYANPLWYYDSVQGWSIANFASCTLTTFATTTDTTGTQVVTWPADDSEPPAIIESLSSGDTDTGPAAPSVPATDVGLLPPKITELLPNPDGTGNDATDEFIELYNANATSFDLSGFVLQTGTTTKHSYTFPAGITLPAKSFVAFYASTTGLSLSNSGGQSDLLDPLGTVLSQSDPYDTAKDGQAWALANGSWYWTLQPTPNATNVINQTTLTTIAKSSSSAAAAKLSSGATKGASTTSSSSATTSSNAQTATADVTPIHPLVLAGVAVLAVAYGVYEYRHDLANKLHQFRDYRAARRNARR